MGLLYKLGIGRDKFGYDKFGYDKDGYDKDGYDKDGYDKDGYDKDGYNRDGYNIEGLKKDGNCEYGGSVDDSDRDGNDELDNTNNLYANDNLMDIDSEKDTSIPNNEKGISIGEACRRVEVLVNLIELIELEDSFLKFSGAPSLDEATIEQFSEYVFGNAVDYNNDKYFRTTDFHSGSHISEILGLLHELDIYPNSETVSMLCSDSKSPMIQEILKSKITVDKIISFIKSDSSINNSNITTAYRQQVSDSIPLLTLITSAISCGYPIHNPIPIDTLHIMETQLTELINNPDSMIELADVPEKIRNIVLNKSTMYSILSIVQYEIAIHYSEKGDMISAQLYGNRGARSKQLGAHL